MPGLRVDPRAGRGGALLQPALRDRGGRALSTRSGPAIAPAACPLGDLRVETHAVGLSGAGLRPGTDRLLARLLSPLCGIDTHLGTFLRGSAEPRVVIAGAEITGVHVLMNRPRPVRSYHIGGGGLFPEEAILCTLAESLERYAQFLSGVRFGSAIRFGTAAELSSEDARPLGEESLRHFTPAQLSRPGFPFQAYGPERPLGWLPVRSLVSRARTLVPAQLLLLGYNVRQDRGEPWIAPAVTTGTAAHRRPMAALRNALLELIQLDALMGHWYGAGRAPEIVLDGRTEGLGRLLDRALAKAAPRPRFHWLQSPDLPGLTVACRLDNPGGAPACAIGVGSSMRLGAALYKAFLEAVGVLQLSKLVLLEEVYRDGAPAWPAITLDSIYDLDRNVAYYALPGHQEHVDRAFCGDQLAASALPPDSRDGEDRDVRTLVDGFRTSGKELYFLDLTTVDLKQVGFTAVRAWSPDTLVLSLPSAPALAHPRYAAFGGVRRDVPHPYP